MPLAATQTSPHHPAPVARAERFIAAGRVVLATGSLIAIWLDPSSPANYVAVTYTLLTAYVVYAVVLGTLLSRAVTVPSRWPIVTHVVDIACFGAFMYFTEGPTSPFFVYFIFSLVAATIRWHSRGALWTALAVLAMFLLMGVYSAARRDPSFETSRFIIRVVYLAVAATLLHYLGRYHERRTAELHGIAAWAWQATAERRDVFADIVAHAAAILRTDRVLLLFEEPEEPWVNVVSRGREGVEAERHDPDLVERLEQALGRESLVVRRSGGGDLATVTAAGSPAPVALDSRVLQVLADQPAVTCAIEGSNWRGRLFAACQDPTVDDVRLAEVVGVLAAARLDHMFLLLRLRDAAVGEERMRFARDLHDGLLQSLAAAAIELKTAERLLEHDQAQARSRLRNVEEILLEEQRELRTFIRQLRPESGSPEQAFPLDERLRQLAERVRRHWSVQVDLTVEGSAEIPPRLRSEIYRLAHEAIINAARHAGGTHVRARVTGDGSAVTVSVEDDGCGFPFEGTYELPELIRRGIGPATLKDRVTALNGRLSITSSGDGARLSIVLPVS